MNAGRIQVLCVLAGAITLGGCTDAGNAKVEAGAMTYQRVCTSCHSTGVGPNLNGIVGRKVASVPGFTYSDAMKRDSTVIWTEDRIKNYLMGPLQMYPEGRMVITPLKPEEADEVVAFLKDRQPG